MNHYVLTQPAIDDIDTMLQYLVPLNPQAAATLAELFYDAFRLLLDNPLLGVVSEDDDEVFIWHIPKADYSVPYLLQGEVLIILRVFHQRQQKPSAWQ